MPADDIQAEIRGIVQEWLTKKLKPVNNATPVLSTSDTWSLAQKIVDKVAEARAQKFRERAEVERARLSEDGLHVEVPDPPEYKLVSVCNMINSALGLGGKSGNKVSQFQSIAELTDQIMGGVARHIANGERLAVRQVSEKNAVGEHGEIVLGYARVLQGEKNCVLCLMLASRGPVYTKITVGAIGPDGRYLGEEYHEHCDCRAVLVVKGKPWEGQADFEVLNRLWRQCDPRNLVDSHGYYHSEHDRLKAEKNSPGSTENWVSEVGTDNECTLTAWEREHIPPGLPPEKLPRYFFERRVKMVRRIEAFLERFANLPGDPRHRAEGVSEVEELERKINLWFSDGPFPFCPMVHVSGLDAERDGIVLTEEARRAVGRDWYAPGLAGGARLLDGEKATLGAGAANCVLYDPKQDPTGGLGSSPCYIPMPSFLDALLHSVYGMRSKGTRANPVPQDIDFECMGHRYIDDDMAEAIRSMGLSKNQLKRYKRFSNGTMYPADWGAEKIAEAMWYIRNHQFPCYILPPAISKPNAPDYNVLLIGEYEGILIKCQWGIFLDDAGRVIRVKDHSTYPLLGEGVTIGINKGASVDSVKTLDDWLKHNPRDDAPDELAHEATQIAIELILELRKMKRL